MLFNFFSDPVNIILVIMAVIVSIVLHEIAHAYIALKNGDDTAKRMGRLSFNPLVHFEPTGFLMMILLGFGFAKPVPVNPFNYRNYRWGNFWVSIAGVLTNLILGFIFSLAYFLMVHYVANENGAFANDWLWGVTIFFQFMMAINIMLMIFNLIPVPPLDGYNMLKSMTRPDNRYMHWARNNQHWLIMAVLLIAMFTGAIWHLREGIIWIFMSLWGLMF